MAEATTIDVLERIKKLESYCAARDYAGFCKFDALNSRFYELLFGHTAITRLLISQVVNRIPLPLRSLGRVQQVRNPKGIANFAKGYAALYRLTGEEKYRVECVRLVEWLLTFHSRFMDAYFGNNLAWGYPYPWQSPGFFAPRHSPNCIVTAFVAEAILSAYEITRKARYLEACERIARYFLEDLPVLEETTTTKCIGYVQKGLKWRVININAVAGAFLAKLGQATGKARYTENAIKLINWTCQAREEDYSWNYTSPKKQSGIGPDNYHTGGILDGIFDIMMVTGDRSQMPVYRRGLDFYEKNFFTAENAPKWRVHKDLPYDIHGAAQGILTFSRAGALDPRYFEKAEQIAKWTFENLWDAKTGRFFYQKRRFFTWKIDLMRWNNSWMFTALTDHLQRTAGEVHAKVSQFRTRSESVYDASL